MTAAEIENLMLEMRDDAHRDVLMRFFKTEHPGDYGYGDKFLGIDNPGIRSVVKFCRATQPNRLSDAKPGLSGPQTALSGVQPGLNSLALSDAQPGLSSVQESLPQEEIPQLLTSQWHEVRMCGFLILVDRFEKLCGRKVVGTQWAIDARDCIVRMYLDYADYANNWDLVDLSVHKILGRWLIVSSGQTFDEQLAILDSLSSSDSLWRNRMSVVCTWMTSRNGNPFYALRYCERHLGHPHDLMHKAVGWMLREMGKGCGMDLLRSFLDEHINEMSRTTLRYAIEKMDADERRYWMNK